MFLACPGNRGGGHWSKDQASSPCPSALAACFREVSDGAANSLCKAIGEKLKAAVKAGKMTEEEAKAKWAEIMKKARPKTNAGNQGKKRSRRTSIGEHT
jgi:hypothetical protein